MQITRQRENQMRMGAKVCYIIITLVLILLDQASKYTIRTRGGFYICNRGVAFGIQAQEILVFVFVAIIVLFLISRISNSRFIISNIIPDSKRQNWKLNFKSVIKNSSRLHFPLVLILAGGISNLVDRIHSSCVIDFIDLKFWPVFNLADIYITIGGITILSALLKKSGKKSSL